MRIIFILTILNLFFFNKHVIAATQGNLGTTSTGTIDISLSLQSVVQISNLDDINFPVWGGSGDFIKFDSLCIYSNDESVGAGYNITATGSGSGSAFTLSDGGVNTIAYNAYWNDTNAGNDGNEVQLTTNIALTGQGNVNNSATDCGGTDNASVIVEFKEATLSAATVASYTGVLTLVIAPE